MYAIRSYYEARETLVSMEITLLYMTAVRAERRLGLLDRLIKAGTEELTAAEQVLARYETALRTLRSARRLDRLNSDERMLVRSGIVLIKYWFSVSDEEQEHRFQARIENPTKRWKLSSYNFV